MNDFDLIKLLKNRDPSGIELFLRDYSPLMRYIIAPILPDYHDQEECLSEITARIWEKIDLYDSKRGNWTSWLTALTRNTALNRAKQNQRKHNFEELSDTMPSQSPTPEQIILKQEQQKRLVSALQKLSTADQLLFYRKYYYLQSTAQIASELHMTERAVEGKLYRIKKKLRKELGGANYD